MKYGKLNKTGYAAIMLMLTILSCQKPYRPPAIRAVTGYLVIEGIINAGNDSTKFMLSRTVNLDSLAAEPVTGATVTVEGSNSTSYPLNAGNIAGQYTAGPLGLDNSQTYRLHVKTPDGKEYISDFVGIKITPPIDSIYYKVKTTGNQGIQVNLDTHDPANNTKYYRWDFVETWRYHSKYESSWVSNGDTVLQRTPAQQIYFCFQSDSSSSILLGTSAKLIKDVISTAPIAFIPSTSQKLQVRYSINVKQYALTSDAYNFWQNLKKNTEDLGSIFDVQPSQVNGNIHCVSNPNEPVIGYISASTVTQQRIFIDSYGLPDWITEQPFICALDSVLFVKAVGPPPQTITYPEDLFFNYNKGGGAYIPVQGIYDILGNLLGHTGSYPDCVDCRFEGGALKQPSFWK